MTKLDSLEKMCSDIRKIAEVTRYGTIWYPTKANPSLVCEVHNGLVTLVHILFINVKQKEGKPVLPDHKVMYKND